MLAPDTTEGVAGAPTFGTIMLIKHLSNPKGRQEPGNSVPSDRPRATSGPCSVHSRRSRCAPIPPPCRSKRVRQGPLLPSIFCRAGSFASSDGQKLPVVTGDARLQRRSPSGPSQHCSTGNARFSSWQTRRKAKRAMPRSPCQPPIPALPGHRWHPCRMHIFLSAEKYFMA